MAEFFSTLTYLQKFFAVCAILGGIMFVVRTFFMFIGGIGDVDADVAMDGDLDISHGGDSDISFKLLSLQGITGFFMMFGLTGLALSYQFKINAVISVIGALIAGSITVWIIAFIFRSMMKLQSDGTVKMNNAIGKEGIIYLTIKAGSRGKVQVEFQGRLMILEAVSADGEEIKTDERVKVTQVIGGDTLVVEKI